VVSPKTKEACAKLLGAQGCFPVPSISHIKQSVGWGWKVCAQQPALEVRIGETWIVRAAESLQPSAALSKRFASAMIDQQIPELTVEIAAGKGCEYRPHLSGP
jgi:hypothetical protein